jgi:uncharacterized protein YlbG (UPF0298 family)
MHGVHSKTEHNVSLLYYRPMKRQASMQSFGDVTAITMHYTYTDTMYINSNNMNTYAQHAPMVPTLWLFLQIEFIPQLFQM